MSGWERATVASVPSTAEHRALCRPPASKKKEEEEEEEEENAPFLPPPTHHNKQHFSIATSAHLGANILSNFYNIHGPKMLD